MMIGVPSDFLTLALLLPLVAVLFFAFFPVKQKSLAGMALIVSWAYAVVTVLAFVCAFRFGGLELAGPNLILGVSGFEMAPRFFLDGRNAPFLLLLGLCLPVVFTLLRDYEARYSKSYYIAAFALVFSLAGVFTSDSLLLFYFFWEAALISVYFWIGLYGSIGHSRSVYPVLLRFVLFTLAGSLPMLVSIAALCVVGGRDPGLHGLAEAAARFAPASRLWIFAGFLLGFAVKLPLFGFHGWLRDTYAAAPPACRALLSAAMSKMGAFGLIFVLVPTFVGELRYFATPLEILAVIGVVYGALLTLAQERLLDILIYGSLSHLSLLALGVFAAVKSGATSTGLSGAILLAFNHGVIMVMLLALDSRILKGNQSPDMRLIAGLRGPQRRLAAFLLLSAFASASLPGLGNFVGEILIYFTAFKVSPWLTLFAGLGALIGAAALVRAIHAIFFGSVPAENHPANLERDLGTGETAVALAMGLLWLVLGLYPMLLLHPVEKALLIANAMGVGQ
jgi:NADH-quinone oxidoreductase subunit M